MKGEGKKEKKKGRRKKGGEKKKMLHPELNPRTYVW